MSPIAIIGATGFVGQHAALAFMRRGVVTRAVRAPRLSKSSDDAQIIRELTHAIQGCTAVVNAAGVASPTQEHLGMVLANSRLPRLIQEACENAGARFIHVSSAAVQGRAARLDSSGSTHPFSLYSQSKAEGEHNLTMGKAETIIYRPAGVHGTGRRTTERLIRFAQSRFAAVAAPGDQNTPQALIENVSDAIAFLAEAQSAPPHIVHHPSEGLTTFSLLTLLGGRSPHVIPRRLADTAVGAAYATALVKQNLIGHARRLEVLLRGQEQAPSWLTEAGWQAPVGVSGWEALRISFARD